MAIGIVETKYGKIEGEEYAGEYQGITVFRGIPYAAPPVGELRFRPPQKPMNWAGVRKCTSFGPAPIQTMLTDRHEREFYFQGTPEMSEDCLYLNVCTGARCSKEKRPVYIWYHGGGLTNCYSYEVQFNPQVLAKKGIIVVTVGHRVNLFGYLCLTQLTKEQGKSGNYGFMDQIAALNWVYENIAAFGGYPENITVGGQSGGCLKCCALAASPAARGKVKRVINQSGNKWMIPFKTLEDQEQFGRRYLQYAGIDPDISVEELRKMPVEKLYVDPPRAVTPDNMVMDPELLPAMSVHELFEKGLGDVDFINGVDYGETEVFAETASGLNEVPVRGFIKEIRNARDFYAHFRNLLGPLYQKYDFEHLIEVTDANAWDQARLLAGLGLSGREGMNVGRNVMLNRYFGMMQKKLHPNAKYFSYLWTHLLPTPEEDIGTARDSRKMLAWHSTELWFTFASLRQGIPPHRPWRESDYDVAERMSTYWANFIKTGDPNSEEVPYWPASDQDFGYAKLGDEVEAHTGLDTKLEQLIYEFVRKEYQLEEV